jgi:nitrate reductase gamma subunit
MREITKMAMRARSRARSRVGPLIAVGVLMLLLCFGIGYLYVGWQPFTHKPGFSLSATGYFAMAVGLLASLVLGAGLTLLILRRKRKE